MTTATPFDEPHGHRYFSAQCFNRTWELIDLSNRTDADDEQMLLRAYASLWHWMQRADCTPRNLSVGYWLVSRVHALLKQPELARHFGMLSLNLAKHEPPFYKAYAYEALARAALTAQDRSQLEFNLQCVRQQMERIVDPEERSLLERDLATLTR